MPDGAFYERLLSGISFQEMARCLPECGYEDMSSMNSQEVTEALSGFRNAEIQDVADAAGRKELIDLFRIPHDYHNAKLMVKCGGDPRKCLRLLSTAGRVDPDVLAEAFRDGDSLHLLPPAMERSVREASEILAATRNPQRADVVLDLSAFGEMRDAADRLHDAAAAGYVGLLTDSYNLKTAVRALRMKKRPEHIGRLLAPGGSVDAEELVGKIRAGESFAGLYAFSALEKAAALGEEAVTGERITAFEKETDQAVPASLQDTCFITFGVGPVLHYLVLLEHQTTALRMILTGSLMKIPMETIRERLREIPC